MNNQNKKAMNTKVTRIVPNSAVSLMCGALFVDIYSSGFVRITYRDGSTEGAYLTTAKLAEARQNFFALVSGVQANRPDTLTAT